MFTMIKYRNRAGQWFAGFTLALFLPLLFSCGKEAAPKPFAYEQPANFPPLKYDLSNNPISESRFVLGRTLFYDGALSITNNISCGSCHQQFAAFSHAGHSVSHGIFDRLGTRNAPALQNLGYNTSFMWDGGIFDLDLQPLAPIASHAEMGEQVTHIIQKLQQSDRYRQLFAEAYGSEEITTQKMLKALSQFMLMLVSADSRYDKYVRQETGSAFSADETAGLSLFRNHCQSCHATDLFTDQSFRNNGLPPTGVNDMGRYAVTLDVRDKYRFKVPGLRNVEKTAPYMHDGRFQTLEAVLDHYSGGVMDSPTLDSALKRNATPGIRLTTQEKQQLISFLKTLTDDQFIHNPMFSEQKKNDRPGAGRIMFVACNGLRYLRVFH